MILRPTFKRKCGCGRLANFANVRVSQIQEASLTHQTRELAENLAACVVGDPKLATGVVPLLREQDERVRSQRDRELGSVIIEAVLACCHENGKDRVQVKEIAALVNTILRSRGEFIEYSPEEAGHQLDTLGLQRTRTAAGMVLTLTNSTRRLVHGLARAYDVISLVNGVPRCPDCKSESASGTTRV